MNRSSRKKSRIDFTRCGDRNRGRDADRAIPVAVFDMELEKKFQDRDAARRCAEVLLR